MAVRSLRSLTLVFLVAVLIATVGTAVTIYAATRATIARLVDTRIDAVSRSVSDAPGADPRATILRRIDAMARDRDTGDIGQILSDRDGHRLGGNVTLRRALPLGYSTLRLDDRIRGLTAGRALVREVGGGLRLTTIAETEPVDDYNTARIRIYVLGFGSIIVIVIGGLLFFGITIARRIGEMRRTVDAIIDGDMQRRVPVDRSGGEFAQQARAFNRMLDRIAELTRGISNVSNDIAHDLRTPLARLRSQLALLERQADTPMLRDSLASVIAQSDELLAIFAAILRIAEVEGGDRRAGFTALDLGALAAEIGAMMQPVVADSGHRLTLGRCDAAPIAGDRQLLVQVLINLIENAVRHTPAGTAITIAVECDAADAIATVGDTGPGIAPDQRAHALRRFGRLDASRSRTGHGLGLPLVQAIMTLHRGSVALEDAAPGLRVVLRVPLRQG